MNTATPLPSAERLIQAFVKVRDMRAEAKRAFEAADDELKTKQLKIKQAITAQMELVGSNQLSCDSGTAYRQISRKFSCADWGTFWPWIKDNDRFDMMQKRVGEKAIADYLEENGELPPAINMFQEYDISVRRK